jgi:hypothetical protein
MALLYDWERPVRDKDGDGGVLGLRDDQVYLDVHQEHGLLIFTPEGFAEFLSAGTEALTEAARRAQAGLPGESAG